MVPGLLRQAYCIVVKMSAQGQPQAFRLTVSDGPLFETVKSSTDARLKDSTIDADTLLPGGPYDLWHAGDTRQRVKVLVNAFAERPALPKMLRTQAIYDTLADGCAKGTFVLLLTCPDRSIRTWWYSRPDEAIMKDKDLELVLPETATLAALDSALLERGKLPELWTSDTLTVQALYDYFQGGKAINVDKGGYEELLFIPKAEPTTVDAAIQQAVQDGRLWLMNEPATVLAEPIPAGVLTETAILREPPPPINIVQLLPANLPAAWADGTATALTIAEALSRKMELPLPWKTIRDTIGSAVSARYLKAEGDWPCEYHAAGHVRLQERREIPPLPTPLPPMGGIKEDVFAQAQLELHEMQDLVEQLPELKNISTAYQVPLRVMVKIELDND